MTRQDLERLKASGKIRCYNMPVEEKPQGRIVAKHFKKRSRALDYIGWNILIWANKHCLELQEEFAFDKERKFRFDWCIDAIKLGVEYEGGVFMKKSGHNTAQHYTKDASKYNLAQQLGYTVLRFTALNYESLIPELEKYYSNFKK